MDEALSHTSGIQSTNGGAHAPNTGLYSETVCYEPG